MKVTATNTISDQQALYAAIIHSSQQAIISTCMDGIITSWNPAAEQLFGFSAGEAIGSNLLVLLPPAHGEKKTTIKEFERFTRSCDTRRQCKDGSIVDISLNISPIKDPRENITGYSIIASDNSAYKQAVEKSAVSVANLVTIFESAEEGFVLLDRNLVIKAFNSKARESIVLNFNNKDVEEGRSVFDYIDKSRVGFFKETVAKVLEGRTIRYQKDYTRADGKTYWFHFTLNPVREGDQVTGICITGNDITKRKLAEETLEQNEKRYRALVENSGDGVVIFSQEAKSLYFPPSIEKLLGYSEQESTTLDLFAIVHPDDLPFVKKAWEKILLTPGVPNTGNICRILHKNGSWRWIDGTITNLLHDPAVNGIVDNFRDITDKIEADKKLKQSEERYRYLFYNNPQPMWIYCPDTLAFLEVNDAAVEKYGYSREEFLNMTLLDIRPKETVEEFMRKFPLRNERKYSTASTWHHLTRNGDILYVDIASHDIKYEGKDAVLVLADDVTEKKKADSLLLEAYRENNNILESIADGFATVDKDWIVTYWNKEAERMSHMPRENILGKNMWDVYTSAIPLKFYSETQKAANTNTQVRYEEYWEPLDIWVDVSVYPSKKGLSIFFRDITERKRADEKIREANDRYEMIARVTNDVIYEWNINTNKCYWGDGYKTLLGHTITGDEMPANTWVDNLHPEEKQQIFEDTYAAFEQKKTSMTRELRFRCADGTYKEVFDKLVIVYDHQQRPLKVLGAMQDISELKKNELAIRVLNEQLNKRAEELVKSNEELERFAYVASHDLQEPLRMVSSFLQLLQRKYKDKLDDTAGQYIEFAVDGAERMKRLILDLLEYSRVGTNKDALTTTDMKEVVATVLMNFSTKIAETNAIINVLDVPVIQANKMQVTQLIQNLVGNALKYNTSPAPQIVIGYEDKGDAWQFFVKDNGIGIEKKFLDKVFIIFQRLHNKNQFSGTGIGLAICKKIVERHGGNIWIESTPGEGSTFLFTIKK